MKVAFVKHIALFIKCPISGPRPMETLLLGGPEQMGRITCPF